MSVLDEILDRTRAAVREGRYAPREAGLAPPDGARFTEMLREPGTRIIAEIKAKSPSAGEVLPHAGRKIETIALAYRRGHAAAISVVTEREFFGGDPEWIGRARRISGLPVLMKDFVLEESQLDFAVSWGADAVLLLVSAAGDGLPGLVSGAKRRGLAPLVEAHGAQEIARACDSGAEIIGVNARDLGSFAVDVAALVPLAAAIPADRVRVAESGIRSRADVERLASAGFGAFLIGETLLRAEDPEETLRELRGAS